MSSEERELSLLSKVEMRIALAATDEKLESLLDVYFAPLLLKLGSQSQRVREKVVSICKHINTRIEPSQISLPVAKLVEQFKKDDSASLVRQFDLIYIRMGLKRMPLREQRELLPTLLDGIAGIESSSSAAVVFNLVLKLLDKHAIKGGPDDQSLRTKLGITPETAQFLSKWFGKLLLFTPGGTASCPGLSEAEYKFINAESVPSLTWNPEAQGGLNLTATKITVARLLASGAFLDAERRIPAIIASADSNNNISDIAEDMLRRFNLDLENSALVDELFDLYLGRKAPQAVSPVRPPLRIKILSLLCKSAIATKKISQIEQVIDDGLGSPDAFAMEGLQATKLRNQIFSFVAWFARAGSKADLSRIGQKTIDGLTGYIAAQGWPSPRQALGRAETDLRALAYETIGLLIPTANKPPADGSTRHFVDLTQWLFVSLSCDNSHDQISVSIDKTLGSLLSAISNHMNKSLLWDLGQLLLRQLGYERGGQEATTGYPIVRSTKFAAIRFANGCLPFSSVTGRCIALLGSGDQATEVAEEGRKGLDPYWYAKLNPQRYASSSSTLDEKERNSRYEFPQFDELVEYLFNPDEPSSTGAPCVPKLFSKPYFQVYLNTMTFLRNILLSEALEPARTALDADESDWGHRLDTVLSTDEVSRKTLRKFIQASEPGPLLAFLQAAAPDSIIQDLNPGKSLMYFVEIASLAPDSLLENLLRLTASVGAALVRNPALDQRNQRVAARVVGILGSHPDSENSPSYDVTEIMGVAVESVLTAKGQAIRKVCGTVLAMGYWLSRMSFRNRMDDKLVSGSKEYLKLLLDLLEKSKNQDIRNAALIAIGQLGLAELVNAKTVPEGCSIAKLREIIFPKGSKGDMELAVRTWGRISSAGYQLNTEIPTTEVFEQLTKPLFDQYDVRDIEVQFAIGEALCEIAVGWKSKSLITEFDVDAPWPESAIPDEIITLVLDHVLERCKSLKPSEKKASVIWLLSLVRYCGDSVVVQESLRRCQAAFLRLVSDRDEIVQDSASRGLSLVYEMGNQEFKDDLVRDLVQFFTADSSLASGSVMVGTELFEQGELPTGEGSSVRTYKDIVNLASEVGNPSLVYKFMSLASNKAMWTGRAAFGKFGLSNVLSDSNVGGYLAQNPKLYPKLYRYMFDPNPNVRSSMKAIWDALVKDTNAVVDEHFDGIMEELLGSIMNGKEWRVREACCLAISNLIQGQSIEKYDKYLQEILTKGFKVLDDIKGSVRVAAFKLARTLSNIAIHTLETGDARSKRATLMLGHLVPFLMGPGGLESSAEEVQHFSMATLMEIIKKCPKDTLRPLAAPIMQKYLLSLSSLEPQAANYLHLNADKYNMTSTEVDSMRLTALRASPMMEVVETYLLDALLHPDSIEETASTLITVIKSAIGMPSKVACTSVLITMCRNSIVFKPYADRFLQLARAQVFDRDQNVSAAYCVAVGHLARLASDPALVKAISWAKELYFSGEHENSRLVAGEVLQAISRYAPDQFKGVEGVALPLVFVGTHDTDPEVKEWFCKVWDNHVSGTRVVMLYLDEILALTGGNLASKKWAIKHTCALTVAGIVKAMGNPIEVGNAEKVWPQLRDALAGKTWEGKERVLGEFPVFVERAKGFWGERKDVAGEMTTIARREAKRNNPQYKPHALRCLGEYAVARKDVDLAGDAVDIGRGVWDEIGDTGMDVDSGDPLKLEEDTFSAVVECVLQCLNPGIGASALAKDLPLVATLINDIASRSPKATHSTLFTDLASFFDRFAESTPVPDPDFQTALTALLDTTLFKDVDIPLERIRLARATAVLKFVKSVKKTGVVRIEGGQREAVRRMSEAERSFEVGNVWREVKGLLGEMRDG